MRYKIRMITLFLALILILLGAFAGQTAIGGLLLGIGGGWVLRDSFDHSKEAD